MLFKKHPWACQVTLACRSIPPAGVVVFYPKMTIFIQTNREIKK